MNNAILRLSSSFTFRVGLVFDTGVKSGTLHLCNFDIEEHDIEDSSIQKLKTTISGYADIEGAFFDIDKSLISGHTDIEVENVDMEDSLIYSSTSYCFDIEAKQQLGH